MHAKEFVCLNVYGKYTSYFTFNWEMQQHVLYIIRYKIWYDFCTPNSHILMMIGMLEKLLCEYAMYT